MLDGGQGIVGMHLDGKVLEGIDKLEQQGEFVPGVGIDVFAHQGALIGLDQLRDGFAGQGAFLHHAHQAFHVGKFPAFANVLLFGFQSLVGGDFLSAPHEGGQDGVEFERIQHTVYFPMMNSSLPPETMSLYSIYGRS